MRPRYWFLKFYLIIALIVGFLSLSDNLLSILNISINIYDLTLLIIGFLFFFFNVLAIPMFHHHKVEKIAYVLPVYHLVTYLVFLGLGIYLALLENVSGWIWSLLLALGFITSSFEIAFSAYLLKRLFRFQQTPQLKNYRPSS